MRDHIGDPEDVVRDLLAGVEITAGTTSLGSLDVERSSESDDVAVVASIQFEHSQAQYRFRYWCKDGDWESESHREAFWSYFWVSLLEGLAGKRDQVMSAADDPDADVVLLESRFGDRERRQ